MSQNIKVDLTLPSESPLGMIPKRLLSKGIVYAFPKWEEQSPENIRLVTETGVYSLKNGELMAGIDSDATYIPVPIGTIFTVQVLTPEVTKA